MPTERPPDIPTERLPDQGNPQSGNPLPGATARGQQGGLTLIPPNNLWQISPEAALDHIAGGKLDREGATTSAAAQTDPDSFAFSLRVVSQKGGNSGPKSPSVPQPPLSAQTPNFGEDLAARVGRIRLISRPGISDQVRITLEPRDLGSIDLRLQVDDENRVHLLISTDSDATRELLNRQMSQLKEALARQNLGFGDVTVQVDVRQKGEETEWKGDQHTTRRGTARSVNKEETPPDRQRMPANSSGNGGLSIFA